MSYSLDNAEIIAALHENQDVTEQEPFVKRTERYNLKA